MIKRLQIAEKAAEKAMEVALYFLNDAGVLKSEIKDIKTLADLRMNESILKELEFTQIPILSEETDFSKNEIPEQCWIVDPLDGTFNFSRKYPCAGISIGFLEHGNPVLGVVKDIFNNITYSCVHGEGAKKNEIKMEVSKTAELKDAILATGFPSGASYETNDLLQLVKNIQEFKKIRAIGAASIMLCYVADGIFDAYYEKDIYIWDVAAGLSLVEEAGGQFFIRRTPGTFKYEVLASNKVIFHKAKSLLIK